MNVEEHTKNKIKKQAHKKEIQTLTKKTDSKPTKLIITKGRVIDTDNDTLYPLTTSHISSQDFSTILKIGLLFSSQIPHPR